jgi:prepilin-type N-terminal cleavage/methylation domain-containing protein
MKLISITSKIQNTRAFTLTELVVVVAIIAILSIVGFASFSDNIVGARDSSRINDIEKLQIDLKNHKQKEGAYPLPVNPINITNSGTVIYEGILENGIISNVLSNIPKDPRTNSGYWYSTTTNRQQFQIALTLENIDTPKALVKGDYKSIMKDLFPTLFLAVTTDVDVNTNTHKFILSGGSYNLPYDMRGNLVANGTSLVTLQSEA